MSETERAKRRAAAAAGGGMSDKATFSPAGAVTFFNVDPSEVIGLLRESRKLDSMPIQLARTSDGIMSWKILESSRGERFDGLLAVTAD